MRVYLRQVIEGEQELGGSRQKGDEHGANKRAWHDTRKFIMIVLEEEIKQGGGLTLGAEACSETTTIGLRQ